jgi:hypothetical protein
VFTVHTSRSGNNEFIINVGGIPIPAIIDSGATANIIDRVAWIQLLSQMIRNTPDWLYHRFYSLINWNPKLKILQFSHACEYFRISFNNTFFQVITCATVNIIDRVAWEDLKHKQIKCETKLSSKKLYAYGSDKPLTVAGSFIADVRVKDKCVSAEFVTFIIS